MLNGTQRLVAGFYIPCILFNNQGIALSPGLGYKL